MHTGFSGETYFKEVISKPRHTNGYW